ncbi:MAG: response regulator transcription factor [Clostridiaceae bacterium]|nr:response regulator transcription factor [Clostridiaceae bacterium]
MENRKPRVLVVEDEVGILQVNTKHLAGQGYEVVAAQTLREAKEAVIHQPPDIVVLDVMLPDGSGYDFCRELREITTAPVIFLTSLGEKDHVVQGLLNGGDDYITKPYDLEVLSARVMAQLRRSGLHGAGRIEMPPLSINLQNGTALLDGTPVMLTQKELQLLAYLVSHAGRECSAAELYESVWGAPSNNSTHTVTTHISSIRSKLGLDLESPFEIRSTSNKGYLFLKILYE